MDYSFFIAMIESTEKNLSLVRKYLFEIALVVLCAVVMKLQYRVTGNESEIKNYLKEDRSAMIKVIENNTRAMNEFVLKTSK